MYQSWEPVGQIERFDSFWEGPEDVEKGYRSFAQFYRVNYVHRLPEHRAARVLVISCGPGYFVKLLKDLGYGHVLGIDSQPDKIQHAVRRGLPCQCADAFAFLTSAHQPYDVIVCEQELNHLTKQEMVQFLNLVWEKLSEGGKIVCHGLNGANPIVGAETLAQNFDHYNTFTAYSLRQVLEHCRFQDIDVFGLHLYVFYKNPLNYVAWSISSLLNMVFCILFVIYGKSNKIFTKKIGAVAVKRSD